MRIYNLKVSQRFGSYTVLHALVELGVQAKSPSSRVSLEPLFLESLNSLLVRNWQRYQELNSLGLANRRVDDVIQSL